MRKSILINREEGQVAIYVLEKEKIVEQYVFLDSKVNLLGNIYACKVADAVNGMQAAFVDIGVEKNAYISLKDAMPKVDETVETYAESKKISDILKPGDIILAQVKKEPINEKGARISTHITLPGKYVVIMPNTNIITVSQKIEMQSEKERLKKVVKEVLPMNMGAIIRTDAENINEEVIKKDIDAVVKVWKSIENKYENTTNVSKLYSGYEMLNFVFRDILDQNTLNVYTNDRSIYEEIVEKYYPMVELCENEDLIEKFGLVTEGSKIHDKKVWLKCGGQIIIDKTEALTAIDVNSGKFTGKETLETTVFKVNMEAAVEIMKQLRLKDIGGIIIIDFIDMENEEHKEKILEIMKDEAKKDRSKVKVYEFTNLNLVEVARKKVHV